MPGTFSSQTMGFGDRLALARLYWVLELEHRLERRGWPGYRRSDALMSCLAGLGPVTLSRTAGALRVSHQAARKAVDSFAARGYATVGRAELDRRALDVQLTADGRAYAQAIAAVIEELEHKLLVLVGEERLKLANEVLGLLVEALDAGSSRSEAASPSDV